MAGFLPGHSGRIVFCWCGNHKTHCADYTGEFTRFKFRYFNVHAFRPFATRQHIHRAADNRPTYYYFNVQAETKRVDREIYIYLSRYYYIYIYVYKIIVGRLYALVHTTYTRIIIYTAYSYALVQYNIVNQSDRGTQCPACLFCPIWLFHKGRERCLPHRFRVGSNCYVYFRPVNVYLHSCADDDKHASPAHPLVL